MGLLARIAQKIRCRTYRRSPDFQPCALSAHLYSVWIADTEFSSSAPYKGTTMLRYVPFTLTILYLVLCCSTEAHARVMCWAGTEDQGGGVYMFDNNDNWIEVDPAIAGCSGIACCAGLTCDLDLISTPIPGKTRSAAEPGISDDVFFHDECDRNLTYTSGPSIGSITLGAGYGGTIAPTSNNNNLSFTVQGTFSQDGGTFSPAGGEVTINSHLVLTGGIFNASSGTTNLRGNLTLNGTATFNHNDGQVRLDDDSDQTINGDFDFYTLDRGAFVVIDGDPDGYTLSFTNGTRITVAGNLILAGDSSTSEGRLSLQASGGVGSWEIGYLGSAPPTLNYLRILNSAATPTTLNACGDPYVCASLGCSSICASGDGTCPGWSFVCPPTPTPTPTRTATITPTMTPTYTSTETPTRTPTPSPTSTPTVTPTPTLTTIPAETSTPTATATVTASSTDISGTPGAVSVAVRVVVDQTPVAALPVRIEGQSTDPQAPLPRTDDNGVATQSVRQTDTVTISTGLAAINFTPISGLGSNLAASSPIEVQAERLVQPGMPCRRSIYDTGEEVVFPFVNVSDMTLKVENSIPMNILTREGGDLANTQPPKEFAVGGGLFTGLLSDFTAVDPSNARLTGTWSFLGTERRFTFDPRIEDNPLPLCEGKALLPCVSLSDKSARSILTTTSNYYGRLRRLESQLRRKYSLMNKDLSFKKNRERSYAKIKELVTRAQARSSSCASQQISCKQEALSKDSMRKIFSAGFRPRPPRGRDPFRRLRREGNRALNDALKQVPDFIVTCE